LPDGAADGGGIAQAAANASSSAPGCIVRGAGRNARRDGGSDPVALAVLPDS
jgi:hypothetical protein